jgi:hypothetical protein
MVGVDDRARGVQRSDRPSAGDRWEALFAKLARPQAASTVIDSVGPPARKSTIGRPISEFDDGDSRGRGLGGERRRAVSRRGLLLLGLGRG